MNNKFITVRDLIEILNKVNPNLEVVIEHNNPNYAGGDIGTTLLSALM